MKIQRYLCTGPGGMDCPCCFPRSRPLRRRLFRKAKHKANRDAFAHETRALTDRSERTGTTTPSTPD
jgi:hypothetical protein